MNGILFLSKNNLLNSRKHNTLNEKTNFFNEYHKFIVLLFLLTYSFPNLLKSQMKQDEERRKHFCQELLMNRIAIPIIKQTEPRKNVFV
jgi:hypothetical protein